MSHQELEPAGRLTACRSPGAVLDVEAAVALARTLKALADQVRVTSHRQAPQIPDQRSSVAGDGDGQRPDGRRFVHDHQPPTAREQAAQEGPEPGFVVVQRMGEGADRPLRTNI